MLVATQGLGSPVAAYLQSGGDVEATLGQSNAQPYFD
jgi:hypothetical protein